MQPILKSAFAFAAIFVLSTSCQKVIDVDLNNSESSYIISGEITDAEGPYSISITRSKNFDEDNNFPAVTGAVVIVTDVTSGVVDTLDDAGGGLYKTSTIEGTAGHTYELHIYTDGKSFSSVSTMPLQAVSIDTLYMKRSDFGGDDFFMVPVYTDPRGFGNNYLLRQYVNGQVIKGSIARNDEVTDGETSEFPLYYNTDEEEGNLVIKNGDVIKVELLTTDKGVYEFYRTLEETIDQNSGTPANPLSNITGGAIGVFNAARISTKSAIAVF